MPSKQEEEFELILGNKQLLSLFFVVVVFFAGFFAVGYTVGFSHGEKSGPPPTLAKVDPSSESLNDIRLPNALLKDAPERIPPAAESKPVEKASPNVAESKPEPKEEAPKPETTVAAKPEPKPEASKPAAPLKPQPKPERIASAGDRVASAATTSPGGEYHLQVAALRVRKDADLLAGKLKGMGYPAAVRQDSDWNRVVVGPFASSEAAKGYRGRLKGDGFDTLIKRF